MANFGCGVGKGQDTGVPPAAQVGMIKGGKRSGGILLNDRRTKIIPVILLLAFHAPVPSGVFKNAKWTLRTAVSQSLILEILVCLQIYQQTIRLPWVKIFGYAPEASQ